MGKYLIKRLLHGIFSVIVVVALVMILIYSLMDRDLIFAFDPQFTKKSDNQLITYKYSKWESYGYLDYVPYSDYLFELRNKDEIDSDTYSKALKFGKTESEDNAEAKEYTKKFRDYYESKGYKVERYNYVQKTKSSQILFAYKDISVFVRVFKYFTSIISIDNIHYVERTTGTKLENTGITFTFFDPVYNTDENGNLVKKVFSPAIIGNGTEHKYLLYFDNKFPFIHQNLVSIQLGASYTINKDIDVYETLTNRQDPNAYEDVVFPTGVSESSPRNLHSARYAPGSVTSEDALPLYTDRFTDDYTNVTYYKKNFSRTGFSFVIGIIAVAVSYLLGIPLGILMARHKDGVLDKIGSIYIMFIIAVPSLAYIFLFQSLGGKAGLPMSFDLENGNVAMYVLPIISLALPSIASLMKWIRRYMIDQQNSDYVKFARSGGLTESEIFHKHILKNAIIPIVHGIPGSVLGALVGAIITERVYRVPGAGYMLTKAINYYDNGAIVGLTMFYAILSIVSLILGDILMSIVDPRISFTDKNR